MKEIEILNTLCVYLKEVSKEYSQISVLVNLRC